MKKPRKPIPEFAIEAEERAFWESPGNDSTEYVDCTKARLASFPKLRPSTQTISLRMPEDVLNAIRSHARRLDVPCQSLIKLWCAEKAAELARKEYSASHLPERAGSCTPPGRFLRLPAPHREPCTAASKLLSPMASAASAPAAYLPAENHCSSWHTRCEKGVVPWARLFRQRCFTGSPESFFRAFFCR